jgi:NAD(P)-dependent dehydrogenase (short-subunit alcohol dehydrogenase family)
VQARVARDDRAQLRTHRQHVIPSSQRWVPAARRLRAAKAAIISLSQTLAAEASEYDITVNAICPRAIAGPRNDTIRAMLNDYLAANEAQRRPFTPTTPMDASEVAETILFLVGAHGKRINGQAIAIV